MVISTDNIKLCNNCIWIFVKSIYHNNTKYNISIYNTKYINSIYNLYYNIIFFIILLWA